MEKKLDESAGKKESGGREEFEQLIMSNIEQKIERPRISCFSNILEKPENLEKTELFSPERMAEIRDFISDDKFGPVHLQNNKEIPGWICHLETGQMWGENYFWRGAGKSFVLTRVLEHYLSDAEIELINKRANEAFSRAQDKKLFEEARKVKPEDWSGRVFWNDEYFESVDDFIDAREDEDEELPDYIWAVDDEKPVVNLDLDSILETFTSDAYEDFDAGDLEGREELSAAIEKFNKVNEGFKSWGCSHKIAVVLK